MAKRSPYAGSPRYPARSGPRITNWLTRILLAVSVLLILISFTPLVIWWASALARPWEEATTGTLITFSAPAIDPAGTLSESSYWRSTYAARAWRQGHFERVLIAGGPSAREMSRFLAAAGVPSGRITVLDHNADTHDAALAVAKLVPQLSSPITVLTSDFHVLRAGGAFRKVGMHPTMVPVPDGNKRGQWSTWYKRPGVFADLTEESIALVRYRWNDWI